MLLHIKSKPKLSDTKQYMTEFPKRRTLEFKYQVNEPNQNIDSLSISIHYTYSILNFTKNIQNIPFQKMAT